MGDNFVKKLHDGAIKHAVNDLVAARRRDGKLQKNAYTSIIDSLGKVGVKIGRYALYKCVEREIRNNIPVEVLVNGTNSDLSSFTQQDSNVECQNSSGRQKGSRNKKEPKDQITYNACINSICAIYAAEVNANKSFKRRRERNFLDTQIDKKKAE